MKFHLSRVPSPLDDILLVTDDQGRVRALDFSDHEARLHRLLREHYGAYELIDSAAPPAIAAALDRYFAGDLTALDWVETATNGTPLQRRVWSALRRIPVGRTMTYGELARALGDDDPRAPIEIGAANGANPVNLIVPCHRVIGSNGDLKGYGGGVHRKRWLLLHEGVRLKVTAPKPDSMRLPGF
jgi:methylated-DNA-[protein]-cysteine S-methyltransferase